MERSEIRVSPTRIALRFMRATNPQWMPHFPAAVIEPGASVRKPHRLEPVEIADGALEPDRGRVLRTDRRKASVRAVEREDGNVEGRFGGERHVDGAAVSPQAEQGQRAVGELPSCRVPRLR